jgi:hypothetical protein
MRRLLLISFILLTSNTMAESLFEEYTPMEEPDDVWTMHAEKYDDDIQVIALVNGKIIHGDKFRIRILPDRCHLGNTVTSFLTYMDHSEIEQQQGRIISAMFRGIEIKVQILFAIKAFPGSHLVYMDLGWLGLESIKAFFDGYDEMSLELIDDDDFKATDYFDIIKNTWATTRLNEALDLAERKCEEFKRDN